MIGDTWLRLETQLVRKGLSTISPATFSGWSDTSPPWELQPGESVDDNRPAGVLVVDYGDYSSGGALSLQDTLDAIRTAATEPYYVRMPAGVYSFSDFHYAAAAGVGRCYQDVAATKYFGGLIGAGADQTIITVDPEVMTGTQLAGITAGSPSPVQTHVIYTSSEAAIGVPVFFSGITFRGGLQQEISLSGLTGTAPAPYTGLYVVRAKAGSMIQYCRFEGFGFAAKNSPPYETGAIVSLRADYTILRCEIDGRISAAIDPAQPVASGGIMQNYETTASVIGSWQHSTRRSGYAMHGQDVSEGGNASDLGVYSCTDFQVEGICDTPDSWAGSSLGFTPSNIEELKRTFTYTRPRFTASPSVNGPAHITVGTTNGNDLAEQIIVTDPVIGNTDYNGCLYVRFVRVPNAYGDSPYYTAYVNGGLSALPVTVTQGGVTLAPVLNTDYSSATHTPDSSFIVQV